jgi:hypothetical protein
VDCKGGRAVNICGFSKCCLSGMFSAFCFVRGGEKKVMFCEFCCIQHLSNERRAQARVSAMLLMS